MSYLYMVLSLFSSLLIALYLRVIEHKDQDRTIVIASNYLVAGILSCVLLENTNFSVPVFTFGIFMGLFFFIGFVVFSHAIKSKGVAASVTIGRLSLALPVSLSILLWNEQPMPADIAALVLIFFIILSWEGKTGKISPILLALFLLFGLMDSGMKFFKLHFAAIDDGFFLVIVFFSSLAWSWFYIIASQRKVSKKDVISGMLLGVPNFFSSFFLLKALGHIPAYVVFPFLNVGMIIFSALAGFIVFKETLDKKKVMLLILGTIAVLILTI